MKDIFLSRPNWIDKQYLTGIGGFISLVQAHDLNLRSIGTTDFANQSPMDEVITVIQECMGTIVLGVPQIQVQSGKIKNESVTSPIFLGTEWNHIEAALAYSLHRPLLVIHDKTVSRGIFDRGTLNLFLYSVDMSDPQWPFNHEITGALSKWVSRLRAKS